MAEENFVYFDFVLCSGVLNGAVQIELGANILAPTEVNPTVTTIPTARLRCSPSAAFSLMTALQGALKAFEDSDQPPRQVN